MSEAQCDSNALELELRSDPRLLPVVRKKLRAWAAGQGWTADQVDEIALAVDEALANVIRHAYGSEHCHPVLLTARAVRDPQRGEGLEIRLRDFGKQVDPARICGRALDEPRPGGLGVHLMQAMMSSIEYQPASGGGMLLTMRKYRDHVARCGEPREGRHEPAP